MRKVVLLTPEQKDLIVGKKYAYNRTFNPIQDDDDNWVISIEEKSDKIYAKYSWIDLCPIITFKPKPEPKI